MAWVLAGLIASGLLATLLAGAGSWASFVLAILASTILFRQKRMYRPAALGFALIGLGWFIQISLRNYDPALANPDWLGWDDPFFLLGYCLWLPTILKLGPYSAWGQVSWYLAGATVALTLIFVIALWVNSTLPLTAVTYLLVKLVLLISAVPAASALVNGRTSDGRFFWLMGLGVVWLAEMIYASQEVSQQPHWAYSDALLFVGDGLVALGLVLESYQVKLKPAAWAIGPAGLLAIWIAGVSGLGPHPTPAFIVWAIAGGSLLALAAMASLYRIWNKPDNFITKPSAELDPQDPLEGLNQLLATFQRTLPDLAGLELVSGAKLRVGQVTSHPVACGAKAQFYLSSPEAPSQEGLAQLEAHLIQLAWQAEALFDPLTGVLRRQSLGSLSPWVQKAAEGHIPVALAMIDLDNFKHINDHYGHPAGDQVLARLGEIIRQAISPADRAIRWGGEEFLLLLRNSDLEAADQRISLMRAELLASQFDTIGEPISFSAGLAGGEVPEVTQLRDWLETADQALLAAKRSSKGTNQTMLKMSFLGQCQALYWGKPLKLRPRHADILLALAVSPGLSLEQLTLAVYGESGDPGTCKAEVGRLKKIIPIASRPYRIEAPVEADFLALLKLLEINETTQALQHFCGELLPGSEAPVVKKVREQIHHLLREAALAQASPAVLFQAAQLLDDLELWEACLERLKPNEPNLIAAKARYSQLRKELND